MFIEYCDGGALDSIIVDLEKGLTEKQVKRRRCLSLLTTRAAARNITFVLDCLCHEGDGGRARAFTHTSCHSQVKNAAVSLSPQSESSSRMSISGT